MLGREIAPTGTLGSSSDSDPESDGYASRSVEMPPSSSSDSSSSSVESSGIQWAVNLNLMQRLSRSSP